RNSIRRCVRRAHATCVARVSEATPGTFAATSNRQPRMSLRSSGLRSSTPMLDTTKPKLLTMMGNYPNTQALKSGAVRSDLVDFDFVDVKVANNQFKQVVRDAKYDVAELAIAPYLQAKAYGKPYVLLPAVLVSRGQHHTIAYNAERGTLKPLDLNGKRVGLRAYTVTTATW